MSPSRPAAPGSADTGLLELERLVTGFVEAFGLHQPDQTPCGRPLPVSEAHALLILSEGEPISQTQLGRRLRLTKGTVSRLVTLLVDREWVLRTPHADDGRAVQLTLTGAGQDAAGSLRAARRTYMAALFDQVPAGERDTVLHALDILRKAADEHADHDR